MEEFKNDDFVSKIQNKRKSTHDINKFCGFEKKEEKEKEDKENNDAYLIADIVCSLLYINLKNYIFQYITIKHLEIFLWLPNYFFKFIYP